LGVDKYDSDGNEYFEEKELSKGGFKD